MKNASSLKSKPETPKTPGGISKSLLTPCRRVGLSRNWRKSVASPFNSPLGNTEAKEPSAETRKRKESEETPQKTENNCESDNVATPIRKVELPRRKKSKTLLKSITKAEDSSQPDQPETAEETCEENIPKVTVENVEIEVVKVISTPVRTSKSKESLTEVIADDSNIVPEVCTPVCLKSRSKSKIKMLTKSVNAKVPDTNSNSSKDVEHRAEIEKEIVDIPIANTEKEKSDNASEHKKTKVISPNNLMKECIVVLQKKIFKNHSTNDEAKPISQPLFIYSDSDNVPLNCLNKTEKVETITIDDDDAFATSKPKLKKTNSKTIKEKPAKTKDSKKTNVQINPTQSLDDDDDFCEKRTILIRKTYDKVTKPLKAKSTGSITQKDIEDLKARIETKKKMLLAKSMTETKELRELIKKWQKGCQDALMELMDLMKNKCPEQNMEYSQMLQTLKIPASLVGYDSDNDCFVTPDDENIILSHTIKE